MCLLKANPDAVWQHGTKNTESGTAREDRKREKESEKEAKRAERAKESPRRTGCRNRARGNKHEKEKGVISTVPPKIITHSPLRGLELPGCHFDTVRGIKDIPRARHSWSAINLRTDDYADSNSELPRRRNRSGSLDGGTDYREKWFVELERCASLRDRT